MESGPFHLARCRHHGVGRLDADVGLPAEACAFGVDVVKALAFGASACLIGRPHLWGVAVAGERGVARALEIYRSEIDRVMALCGWDSLDQIDRSVLFDPAARPESVFSAMGRKLTAMLR
jgi:hypothetical protein